MVTKEDGEFMAVALEQARKSLSEGGIPIGAALVCDNKILGVGHNQRVQKASAILHGEMSALENAGRLSAKQYSKCVMYTTLSPCSMCSGAILLYGIPRVVMGENVSFVGEEELLKSRGVEVVNMHSAECRGIMNEFMRDHPDLWNEDIGV